MTQHYVRAFGIALALALCAVVGTAQKVDKNVPMPQIINGSVGTEFWIAIPPNELSSGYPALSLDVQVASAYDTEIEVWDAATETSYKRQIKAGEIRVLSDANRETFWTWEVRESETPVRKAIRITAKHPISVYVLNAKYQTSDGYLAIPSVAFGKKYIATSYYDFDEKLPNRQWYSGFLVIAKEDNTIINIRLRGEGQGLATTKGGKNIGDSWQVSLQRGDVYAVMGNGLTRGVFDLTGSEVTSNVPVGFISFHSRTSMPNLLQNGNGRDHLCEMTPPVDTWGKRYVSVEYMRAGTNPNGKGDVFRVIASQDNTAWTLKFYDKTTKRLLGNSGGKLNAGQFADLAQSTVPTTLTHGYSVWEADKPIFVMQYACSANFDGDDLHDPFMINVVPQEQFIPNTIFQSPTTPDFSIHKLNLIVWADTADPNYVDNLKSLKIDGQTVWDHPKSINPTLLNNHMGKNLHWVTIDFQSSAAAHTISGNGKVKFGGYIFGFGQVNSYGWPAASGFRPTIAVDTLPPLLTFTEDCGDFEFEATELRNIPDPPLPEPKDTDQVETGIYLIDTVFGENNRNYRLVHLTSEPPITRDPPFYRYKFRWEVIDKTKDAYCVFDVYDWAGNYTRDTIWYFAPKLEFIPPVLDFGKLRLGGSRTLPLQIFNRSGETIQLTTSNVLLGTYFRIVSGGLPPVVDLADGQSITLTLEYTGTRETSNVQSDKDRDTVEIVTTCAPFRLPMIGVAAIPRIEVDDFDAGVVGVNQRTCKGTGIRVHNPGSDTLVVSAITGFAGTNFTVSNPTTPPVPFIVLPGGTVFVTEICYERSSVGQDSIDVTFENNGDGPDSISTWIGETQSPGPFISGYDWFQRRVNTLHQGLIYVKNTGNQPLTLTDVTFLDGSKYYPAGSTDANFVFKINGLLYNGNPATNVSLANGDSVTVVVQFRPAARQVYSETIRPVWLEAEAAERTAKLEGVGILPTITTQGATMTCAETPEGVGATRDLVITNDGNMDLTCSVQFAAGTDPQWQWGAPPPPPTFTVSHIPGSNTVRFPVVFTRGNGNNGGSALTINILHDAIPGNGLDTGISSPATATEEFTVGGCTGPDITVTNIDFGRLLANCEAPTQEFVITNTGGGTTALEIRDLQIVGPDAAAFQIINIIDPLGAPATLPVFVPAQLSIRVVVRFTPTEPNAAPWADRTYNARVHVRNYEEGDQNELRPDTYAELTGVGFVLPFSFALTNNKSGQTVNPETDSDITFAVAGDAQQWARAGVTQFTADVIYETLSFSYTPGSVTKGALPADWTISEPVRTQIDNVRSRLSFTASGTTPIPGNGTLFTFRGTLLLGPNFDQAQNLEVDLKRPCLIVSTTGSTTEIVNCALTKRVISLGSAQFSLKPPTPNPASSDVVHLDFGIGIQAPARIDVVSTSGDVVATLVNSRLDDGEYSLSFPASSLPNGTYFIRLTCADYSASQRLVVSQ